MDGRNGATGRTSMLLFGVGLRCAWMCKCRERRMRKNGNALR